MISTEQMKKKARPMWVELGDAVKRPGSQKITVGEIEGLRSSSGINLRVFELYHCMDFGVDDDCSPGTDR
jgi:hypothetical protein